MLSPTRVFSIKPGVQDSLPHTAARVSLSVWDIPGYEWDIPLFKFKMNWDMVWDIVSGILCVISLYAFLYVYWRVGTPTLL